MRVSDAGVIKVLGSHFVHYFSPSGLNPLPRLQVFVVDVTNSMSEQTRQALYTIMRQVVSRGSLSYVYLTGCMSFGFDDMQKNKKYIDECVRPGGSTIYIKGKDITLESRHRAVDTSLLTALSQLSYANQYAGRFPMLLFLADNVDSSYEEADTDTKLDKIRSANKNNVSIFALGLGNDIDLDFLKALTAQNGGRARKIYPDKDAASQMEGFFDEINTPLLSGIRFGYPKDVVDDAHTTALSFPQYYKGTELVVSGKIKEGVTSRLISVHVWGNTSNITVTYSVSGTLLNLTIPSDKVLIKDFTKRLWAYMKIKELFVQLLVSNDAEGKDPLKAEALRMSLEYNFVTPLTSLVVEKDNKELIQATLFRFPQKQKDESVKSIAFAWTLSSAGLPTLSILLFFVEFFVDWSWLGSLFTFGSEGRWFEPGLYRRDISLDKKLYSTLSLFHQDW